MNVNKTEQNIIATINYELYRTQYIYNIIK